MAIFLLDLVVKRLMKTISETTKKREGACILSLYSRFRP
jgi:hypothetical protein